MLAVVTADVAREGEVRYQRRKFGTVASELRKLSEWLVAEGVRQAVMQSTAQYWRPVWQQLEGHHDAYPAAIDAGPPASFASAAQMASWVGVCPGRERSLGYHVQVNAPATPVTAPEDCLCTRFTPRPQSFTAPPGMHTPSSAAPLCYRCYGRYASGLPEAQCRQHRKQKVENKAKNQANLAAPAYSKRGPLNPCLTSCRLLCNYSA